MVGGLGYIGNALVSELRMYSRNIYILDSLLNSKEPNEQIENLTIGCVSIINEIYEEQDFDYVIHLGEYSRVEQSLLEPDFALKNSWSTFPAVLEFVKAKNAKLIYSGSSTKFYDSGNGENLSPYTFAKSQNTKLLVQYAEWFKIDYSIVYFYNVYGGEDTTLPKYQTVIDKFKTAFASGERIFTVTKPGTQRRNFTHIKDTVQGIMLAAQYGKGDGYSICANQDFSILDLCKMFGVEYELLPSNSANRMDSEAENTKIKSLGWKQKHYLDREIKQWLTKYVSN